MRYSLCTKLYLQISNKTAKTDLQNHLTRTKKGEVWKVSYFSFVMAMTDLIAIMTAAGAANATIYFSIV
jgi:hypothetical protein